MMAKVFAHCDVPFFLALLRRLSGGLLLVMASTALAENSALNALIEASVADAKLQQCLRQQLQKQGWQNVADVKKLQCHNAGIADLQGLEQFRQLEILSLYKNAIRRFDASPFAHLKELNLARNKLRTLHLSQLGELETIYVFNNSLDTLHLSQLPRLQKLKANTNNIVAFHYRELPALEKIYLFDNAMETIDIHHLPAMRYMDVRQNPMPDPLYEEMDAKVGVTILHDGNADDWK